MINEIKDNLKALLKDCASDEDIILSVFEATCLVDFIEKTETQLKELLELADTARLDLKKFKNLMKP